STYIPLKVNQAGVIPIIFASSVLYFPTLLQNVIHVQWFQNFVNNDLLRQSSFIYMFIYGTLVVFFAYFYAAISFNPLDTADNIRKYGCFIPGIRPGRPTGDIFRSNVAEGTELGRLAKAYLDAGELVPDEVTIGMVMQAIDQAPGGFVLDGFPRNIRQAEALEAELGARNAPLSAALAFLVDEETAVKRIAGRRTCAD